MWHTENPKSTSPTVQYVTCERLCVVEFVSWLGLTQVFHATSSGLRYKICAAQKICSATFDAIKN
jgi:hypothetical protein